MNREEAGAAPNEIQEVEEVSSEPGKALVAANKPVSWGAVVEMTTLRRDDSRCDSGNAESSGEPVV